MEKPTTETLPEQGEDNWPGASYRGCEEDKSPRQTAALKVGERLLVTSMRVIHWRSLSGRILLAWAS